MVAARLLGIPRGRLSFTNFSEEPPNRGNFNPINGGDYSGLLSVGYNYGMQGSTYSPQWNAPLT